MTELKFELPKKQVNASVQDLLDDDKDAYPMLRHLSRRYLAIYVSIAKAFRCLLKDHVGFGDSFKNTRVALTRRVASGAFE